MKKLFSLLCATTLILSATLFSACQQPFSKGNNKNVIVVIGDGMGENHIENALTYFNLETPNFYNDKKGVLLTASADAEITDSAAAATALATGNKVNNGEVSMSGINTLESISELAKKAGKKVGVITTDSLDGATPAAFSSHAYNRNDSIRIIQGQANSNIDLFIGQKTNTNYEKKKTLFTEQGYTFVDTVEDMRENSDSKKLIATLPNVLSSYNSAYTDAFQLKEMASFAMEFLNNEKGYFLMIEGAYIDKFSHNNDFFSAMCEVRSLIDCVEYLYSTIDENTALIFTADHETGGLQKETNKENMNNSLYTSSNHTAANVPLFCKNFTYSFQAEQQNTEVFQMCKTFLEL